MTNSLAIISTRLTEVDGHGKPYKNVTASRHAFKRAWAIIKVWRHAFTASAERPLSTAQAWACNLVNSSATPASAAGQTTEYRLMSCYNTPMSQQ